MPDQFTINGEGPPSNPSIPRDPPCTNPRGDVLGCAWMPEERPGSLLDGFRRGLELGFFLSERLPFGIEPFQRIADAH